MSADNCAVRLTRVVNSDGEITRERRERLYNPFREGEGYNFKYKSTKIKMYLNISLPEDLSDSDIGKVYKLSRYIYSDTNMLAKRVGHNIVPLTKQDIQEISGLSSRGRFSVFWDKLISNKIIKPVIMNNEVFYCFNPIYFNSTDYLPLYLFLAFQDELSAHLPDWVIERYLDMQENNEQ